MSKWEPCARRIIEILEARGARNVVAIFRASGRYDHVIVGKRLYAERSYLMFESQSSTDWAQIVEGPDALHTLAALLKHIVPGVEISDTESLATAVGANATLVMLFRLLGSIAANEEISKMSAEGLGVVWSPVLFPLPVPEVDKIKQNARRVAEVVQTYALPRPGKTLTYDFRSNIAASIDTEKSKAHRVVQWNIERGYQRAKILSTLSALRPDILILQELDIQCERTQNVNIVRLIAEKLRMQVVFVCEFEELRSSERSETEQGGGIHGNAIFTKLDMSHIEVISHSSQVDWSKEGVLRRQPRVGGRYVLHAKVGGRYHVYCLHSEVFCGALMRVKQCSDAFEHIRSLPGDAPVLLCGDLNTMGHSVVRLSPGYCNDRTRWMTIGETEAEWFHANVLTSRRAWPLRLFYGFTKEEAQKAQNPGLCDPWDMYNDVTFNHPKYCGLVQGKYDWTLLRGITVVGKSIFNHDYSASDHKGLCLDVAFRNTASEGQVLHEWRKPFWRKALYVLVRIAMLQMMLKLFAFLFL